MKTLLKNYLFHFHLFKRFVLCAWLFFDIKSFHTEFTGRPIPDIEFLNFGSSFESDTSSEIICFLPNRFQIQMN